MGPTCGRCAPGRDQRAGGTRLATRLLGNCPTTLPLPLPLSLPLPVLVPLTRCAYRASILYFLLADLARVDPMYQFSLDAYVSLFTISLDKSARSDDLQVRGRGLARGRRKGYG